MELQGRLEELRRAGLGLAAISYDSAGTLADFVRRRSITFPLLSDPGSTTIKRYGLLNTTIAPDHSQFGIPFPGTFLLDEQGRVTSRFFEPAYQERLTVSVIMARLGRDLTRPVTTASSQHLELRAWSTDDTLVPGRHVSLVVDIVPRPGMHVYAPGAQGYRVIRLDLTLPQGVLAQPLEFPASEIYFFAPLKERVPVYQKTFRLEQELVLDASRRGTDQPQPGDKLVVNGRLDYQACDDRICYNPTSIPLSWTFGVESLDRERVTPR